MSTATKDVEPKQRDKYEIYEQRKAQLPNDLSPAEYEAACKRIADELGV